MHTPILVVNYAASDKDTKLYGLRLTELEYFSMHTPIVVVNYAASDKDTKLYGLRLRRQNDIASSVCFSQRDSATVIVGS